jgi:hypothetical protein
MGLDLELDEEHRSSRVISAHLTEKFTSLPNREENIM